MRERNRPPVFRLDLERGPGLRRFAGGQAPGGVHLGVQELDPVPSDLVPAEPQELARVDAVPAEVAVHRPGGRVAGPPGVEDEHPPPAPAEHERGAEAGRPAAHDQDVVDRGPAHRAEPSISIPRSFLMGTS